jgi:hypothetical protein
MTTSHKELCDRLSKYTGTGFVVDDARDAKMLLEAQAARITALEVKCALLAASLDQEERHSAGLEAQIAAAKGHEPVVKIHAADEYGPLLEWSTHWVELIGKSLYAHPPTGTASEGGIRFAGIVLKAHRNDGWPGDVDGDVLQQAALDCGLIEERRVAERCGETCTCAESAEFPTVCYFNTEAGKACIDAAIAASNKK